jgi:hypothetical protein
MAMNELYELDPSLAFKARSRTAWSLTYAIAFGVGLTMAIGLCVSSRFSPEIGGAIMTTCGLALTAAMAVVYNRYRDIIEVRA